MKFIVLLRGVNVSGKNKLIMKEFVAQMQKIPEISNILSYIQSGNFCLVSEASHESIKVLFMTILKTKFDITCEVFVYTLAQFIEVKEQHPFDIFPKRNYVSFLKHNQVDISVISDEVRKNDQLQLIGNHLHILYDTLYSQSKLDNNYLEKKLGVISTMRNWNTVCKLVEKLKKI